MVVDTLHQLQTAAGVLFVSAIIFTTLALCLKGEEAIRAGRRAMAEVRLNLSWYVFDLVCVAPLLVMAVGAIRLVSDKYSIGLVSEQTWVWAGGPVTFVTVVFVADFVSYWRHRLEHTPWLWPAHAIHHSDSQMTWLTLARFHPINRAVTICADTFFLALLGFPLWALAANHVVRHYYGEFIHADLPWTYGPLRWVFVSPVMHRWHHARDVIGTGSNFATVFSAIDRAFGTFHVPGPCNVPLGVTDDPGHGLTRQLAHPFTCWLKDFRSRATGLQPTSARLE